MKNAIKWFGIIALAAIIGFSFVACGGDDDDGGGVGGGGGRNLTWTAVEDSTIFDYISGGNTYKADILAIAYGNGMFVAGGESGKMATSTDGVTWTAVANSGMYTINAITYANDKFVAVGDWGRIAISTDGVTWTRVFNLDNWNSNVKIKAIAYGDGKFVAVGNVGNEVRWWGISTDGTEWTEVNRSTNRIQAITYGNGMFVAVIGYENPGYYGDTYTSTDGITWDSKFSIFSNTMLYAITYGNGKFVAGGIEKKPSYASNNVKMGTSTDGITWTDVDVSSIFFTFPIRAITYGNGMFVAGGNQGKMATSTSGTKWTEIDIGTSLDYEGQYGGTGKANIYAIAYGNGKIVAGGTQGKMAYAIDK